MTARRTASIDAAQLRRADRVVVYSRWLCLIGAALGVIPLLGWMSGSPLLYTLVPDQPAMMPNTGVALLFAGVAGSLLGWPERPRSARLLCMLAGAVVLLIGGGSLLETGFGIDLHIDQLLFHVTVGTHPGRPSPPTALALALLGGAILLFDTLPRSATRPSEWLLIWAALIGLVGVTGQILGTGAVRRLSPSPLVGMAVPASVSILVLAIGMLMARPLTGVMAVSTSSGPGGTMMRRIAPESVLVPILLGFGITRLFRVLNIREFPLVVASVAVATMALGLAILDITARLLNRTHDELVTNRNRLRDIVANASDGIFITDREGRLTEVNEAGARILALEPADIIGRPFSDFTLPEEVERFAAHRAAVREGGTHIAEWHLRTASGRFVPVEASTSMLPDGQWQAFVRDISQRVAEEEAALRAAEKIEGIISIASDAIIAIDESQRITIFNHGAEQTFGWTAEEAIGKPLDVLIPERFRTVHRDHVRVFVAGAASTLRLAAPIYGLRKDGTEFMAEAAISKLHIDDELTCTVVMRDVTAERRRAEHDRLLATIGPMLTSSLEPEQVAKQTAELLVRELADACIIDRVDDPETGKSVTRLASVHRDPRKQETLRELQQWFLDQGQPSLIVRALATRETKVITHMTPEYLDSIAKSPEHRRLLDAFGPVSIIAVPLQARGLLLGALTFISTTEHRTYGDRDVAFIEEIAQRLALSIDNARLFEEARSAVGTRDEVLRIVAHDLRNPLGTILLSASMLKDPGKSNGNGNGKGHAGGNGTVRKSADTIEGAAKRMNRLIRDLLDVTRSEAGRLEVEHVALPPQEIVRAAAAAQQTLANDASITIEAEAADDLPKVSGDRDRLLQILENLIGNALKFTPAGGKITIAAVTHGDEVQFSVHDTGEGIPAEDLPHIFDRLWAGGNGKGNGKKHDESSEHDESRKRDGSGMGLHIVKALVTAHGGRVWAESGPGQGSTFYFTIPVARQEAVAEQKSA